MRSLTGKVSRRALFDKGLRTFALAEAGAMLGVKGIAANSSIDRAVVSVYLNGGSDGNNMVVPMGQYGAYAAARPKLAVDERQLLTSRPASQIDGLGFHPALAELKNLFDMRALSVVANVGHRRIAAMPAVAAGSAPQTAAADSFLREQDPELNFVPPGGRIPAWTSSLAGDAVQWRASVFTGFPKGGSLTGNDITESGMTMMSNLIHPAQGAQREEFIKQLKAELINGMNDVRAAFPRTGLGLELLQVAGMLRVAHKFNITRPVFQVTHSGYSHVQTRSVDMDRLFSELSTAMAAFYAATAETGMASRVTTYTTSECGRSLAQNQKGGAEPGWGNHYFVMGGSVLGGDVYGQFPSFVLGGVDDASRNGVWRPTTASDEYSAVFARWMGLRVHEREQMRHQVTGQRLSNLNFLTA